MEINGNGKNEKLEIAPLWKSISNHSSARKQKEIKNGKKFHGKGKRMGERKRN